MSKIHAAVETPQYISGRRFVDALKEAFNVERDAQLADIFGAPRNTIATWVSRDLTNHEAMVRTILHCGLNLEEFALAGRCVKNSDSPLIKLPLKKLNAGKVEKTEKVSIDKNLISSITNKANIEIIELAGVRYFVDTSQTTVDDGRYFVLMDEKLKLYKLNKLPQQQVQMQFDDSSVVVNESSLHIIGRVMLVMMSE